MRVFDDLLQTMARACEQPKTERCGLLSGHSEIEVGIFSAAPDARYC